MISQAVGMAATTNADIFEPVLAIYVGTYQWSRRTNRNGLFPVPIDDGGVRLCTIR